MQPRLDENQTDLASFFFFSQDYHWWWRAFLTSGASALYVFLYSVFYFFSRLQITKFVSAMLYMGYTAIMALEFFLLTGSTDKQPHKHNSQLRLLVATLTTELTRLFRTIQERSASSLATTS